MYFLEDDPFFLRLAMSTRGGPGGVVGLEATRVTTIMDDDAMYQ
jgi:hypothetical protein